ncbi:MAG: methyltransferase domain-containing protein [Flavobacterium sp.]|uniref:class I SAM-dependent methyltransferase n=1 Tax=Flavobacterium sp. TaxID=239 RepID=UPI003265D155
MRKPFQGVVNIVRFNWHLYLIALSIILGLFFIAGYFDTTFQNVIYIFCFLIFATTFISLLASFYVYDVSKMYQLDWIDRNNEEKVILNINAGFDETSQLLQDKFNTAELIALDFYNPEKHTEISIKRARKAYHPFPNTKQIETTNLKLENDSADKIIVIFSAHEIRDEKERTLFFKELHRIIKPTGQIYVTEHLRDIPNFLVYNIGCFHFYSKASWKKIFKESNLTITKEIKLNPFVSTFILDKNGNTL